MISEAKMYIKNGGPLLGAEYAVLCHLMANPNRIIGEREICEAVGMAPGRSLCTTVSRLRRALAGYSGQLVTGRSVGYGWVGDPVECSPLRVSTHHAHGGLSSLAVKTQDEVAAELGLTVTALRKIESEALRKLAMSSDLKDAFRSHLRELAGYHYNPFYEIWLYSGEQLADDPQTPC